MAYFLLISLIRTSFCYDRQYSTATNGQQATGQNILVLSGPSAKQYTTGIFDAQNNKIYLIIIIFKYVTVDSSTHSYLNT